MRKNKQIIFISLWIKEYAHVLRVFAGMFFIFSFIAGVFWIFGGSNVEPIAYVCGLFSSLLFSSPSIAEYFVPNRKPVRHMDFDEILKFINTTNGKTDWKLLQTNWAKDAFLKEDPRLRIRARLDDEGIHVRGFVEPWANNYADPSANSYWYDLTYEGALIERFILVSVDGARADLPLPNRDTLQVEPLMFKVAQIFDGSNTLDDYMCRSGLRVEC